ncbi:MAG: formyltransferase family protein [Dehalococcoidia bacterium]
MADKKVGFEITQWLLDEYPEDVGFIVVDGLNWIREAALKAGKPYSYGVPHHMDFDLGILAWWPHIINKGLLSLPRYGWINTHPSLLPHNRGKNPNFWAIVEQAPYGVSIHMVDKGIDSGAIIAQRAIPYDWTDTGATLYEKAEEEMVELFKKAYPKLRKLEIPFMKQDPKAGSFHKASELEPASRIDLDCLYFGRELLNTLRARTFPGHPGCYFEDGGITYEVRVEIKRREGPWK